MRGSPATTRGPVISWLLTFVVALAIIRYTTGETAASTHHVDRAASSDLFDACFLRGGETDLNEQYSSIQEFLTAEDRQRALSHFHIHGWRWHTASLVRESRRLCSLAQRAQSVESSEALNTMTHALHQAAEYVVGFNMKGLHRIETGLMFPWMREKLTTAGSIPGEASKGFARAISQLESDREELVALGDLIMKSASIATDPSADATVRAQAIERVVEQSASVQNRANTMMKIEDTLLVPAIAKLVPASEQHSFNNRVLRNLGLLDSRLYLVAMHEAVEESGNKVEKALFEKAIPSIPQMMIPRWRRKLYEPKAGVLDAEL